MDFSGQEEVPNGKKEEKLDCDSLERLLPVPRVGAQQEKGWNGWNRPETEASSSGQYFLVHFPFNVSSF